MVEAAAARYKVDATHHQRNCRGVQLRSKSIVAQAWRGLMQLLRRRAERLGCKTFYDPQENIDAGRATCANVLQSTTTDLALALKPIMQAPSACSNMAAFRLWRKRYSYVRRVKRSYDEEQIQSSGEKNRSIRSPMAATSQHRPGSLHKNYCEAAAVGDSVAGVVGFCPSGGRDAGLANPVPSAALAVPLRNCPSTDSR